MSMERERFEEINKKIKRETEGLCIMGRRHMAGVSGDLNTVTPCAACKLLRRRCAQECPFSPYFSPDEPQKFASVHKVFGASNVSKMLMEVPETQRADAANSLVYEAKVRLRDPVFGCMGAISALQHQLQSLQAELHLVNTEIFKYKYRENSISTIPLSNATLFSSEADVLIAAPPSPLLLPSQAATTPLPPATPSLSSNFYTPLVVDNNSPNYSTTSNQNVTYYG